MSSVGARIAHEALALVGTPFRLHGRDPESGLDCIGLVALAIERARDGQKVAAPSGYRLRNSTTATYLPFAQQAGLDVVAGEIEPGDILHAIPGPAQDHLFVGVGAERFVHAHAGLRKVVITPGLPQEGYAHHWRVVR